MYSIAVLLTCYNRREKTVKAIDRLKSIYCSYNSKASEQIELSIFLTDDGCTDGTAKAAIEIAKPLPITIIKSDGTSYWAGGMRIAWNAALCSETSFDFFLLLNDDTFIKENCFEELFSCHHYALKLYKKPGIYTGFVSSTTDDSIIIYGAKVYEGGLFSKATPLSPTGNPQTCSMINANVLLISRNVPDAIGILDKAFIHAAADMDYGIRAAKAGFPVLTTAHTCATCDYDHDDSISEYQKIKNMTFQERKDYINRPNIKQYHDSLIFYRRYDIMRYLLFKMSYYLNLYVPSIYYFFLNKRGH